MTRPTVMWHCGLNNLPFSHSRVLITRYNSYFESFCVELQCRWGRLRTSPTSPGCLKLFSSESCFTFHPLVARKLGILANVTHKMHNLNDVREKHNVYQHHTKVTSERGLGRQRQGAGAARRPIKGVWLYKTRAWCQSNSVKRQNTPTA